MSVHMEIIIELQDQIATLIEQNTELRREIERLHYLLELAEDEINEARGRHEATNS